MAWKTLMLSTILIVTWLCFAPGGSLPLCDFPVNIVEPANPYFVPTEEGYDELVHGSKVDIVFSVFLRGNVTNLSRNIFFEPDVYCGHVPFDFPFTLPKVRYDAVVNTTVMDWKLDFTVPKDVTSCKLIGELKGIDTDGVHCVIKGSPTYRIEPTRVYSLQDYYTKRQTDLVDRQTGLIDSQINWTVFGALLTAAATGFAVLYSSRRALDLHRKEMQHLRELEALETIYRPIYNGLHKVHQNVTHDILSDKASLVFWEKMDPSLKHNTMDQALYKEVDSFMVYKLKPYQKKYTGNQLEPADTTHTLFPKANHKRSLLSSLRDLMRAVSSKIRSIEQDKT